MQDELPALQWMTKEERLRKDIERDRKNSMEVEGLDPSAFDPRWVGHRYADQLLPDLDDDWFVWSVAGGDDLVYDHYLETKTLPEVVEIFAKQRTRLYLALEEKKD